MSGENGLDSQSVFFGKTAKGLLEELLIDKLNGEKLLKIYKDWFLFLVAFLLKRLG